MPRIRTESLYPDVMSHFRLPPAEVSHATAITKSRKLRQPADLGGAGCMKASAMKWFHHLKLGTRRFLAVQLRNIVRYRTTAALSRLDDFTLEEIGIPRYRIPEHAREIAHMSVQVPPKKPCTQKQKIIAPERHWSEVPVTPILAAR